MRRFRSALAAHPLIALTTGLLTVVVLLLAIGLLAASVVGWILAIALLGVLIAGAALGLVLVLLAVGESLARRRPTSLLRKIAAGALVLSLFVSVPTAGPWIFLLIVLFGLGAFIAGHVWTTA